MTDFFGNAPAGATLAHVEAEEAKKIDDDDDDDGEEDDENLLDFFLHIAK